MNSENNVDENYFILDGEVNYYQLSTENNIRKSVSVNFLILKYLKYFKLK